MSLQHGVTLAHELGQVKRERERRERERERDIYIYIYIYIYTHIHTHTVNSTGSDNSAECRVGNAPILHHLQPGEPLVKASEEVC